MPMTTETLPAIPGSVQLARAAVTRYAQEAGVSRDRLEDIRLVVSEAVANAVVHAYRHSVPGEVRVSMAVAGGELWVFVADDGEGLRPRQESPGLGLGLSLIAHLCEDFAINRPGSGGTEISMRFALNVSRPVTDALDADSSLTRLLGGEYRSRNRRPGPARADHRGWRSRA